jgi:hypothetical protein
LNCVFKEYDLSAFKSLSILSKMVCNSVEIVGDGFTDMMGTGFSAGVGLAAILGDVAMRVEKEVPEFIEESFFEQLSVARSNTQRTNLNKSNFLFIGLKIK